MKYLNIETFSKVWGFIRRYVSPVYIMMLVAAFVLWYATKLGDTYTTDHEVTVVIDGTPYTVDCTIRGKGIDLLGYTISSRRSSFDISSSELTFDNEIHASEGVVRRHISTVSLQQALAARMSDIEVIAVGSLPPIESDLEEMASDGKLQLADSVETETMINTIRTMICPRLTKVLKDMESKYASSEEAVVPAP